MTIRRMPRLLPRVLLCLVAAGAGFSAAGQETRSFPVSEEDGSTVEVEHVFSAVPPGGFTAVRIVVNNKGKEEKEFRVSSSSTTPARRGNRDHTLTGPEVVVKAGAGSTVIRELIVPLMTDFSESRSYDSRSLRVGVNGAGRSVEADFRTGHFPEMPFAAISQALAGKSVEILNTAVRDSLSGSKKASSGYSRGDSQFLAAFLPAHLPADWRGYLGLDVLAMSDQDWDSLAPGVQLAVRQWMQLGGALDLYHTGPAPDAILQELKVEGTVEDGYWSGAGGVRLFKWDGMELPPDVMYRFEVRGAKDFEGGGRPPGKRHEVAAEGLNPKRPAVAESGLSGALGVRSFAAWQVGVILLIFGILVGPVNLFYLAGPGRRHRLFFTTPVIALGASLVLLAVIFLQDGSGGSGRRAALVELRPDDNNALIRQYQISRTGVLFGGGFRTEEVVAMTPLVLENTRWTRLKPYNSNDGEAQRYSMPEAQSYAGDWFQSRSEQAQLLELIRPGRGRLERRPGPGDPVILSSLPGTVSELYYQDAGGQWWVSGRELRTGGTAALQKAGDADFVEWAMKQLAIFPVKDRVRLENESHAGRFYAISRGPGSGLVETLPSIDWTDDFVFLHGRLDPVP